MTTYPADASTFAPRRRGGTKLIRWLIALALLAAVSCFVGRQLLDSFRKINWQALHINLASASAAVVCLFASRIPFALACRSILLSLGERVDRTWLSGALWTAALGRYVPGKMAAGVGATVFMADRGIELPVAVASLLILNLLMLVVSMLFSIPLAFADPVRTTFPNLKIICSIAAIAGIVLMNPRIFAALCNIVFPRKPLPSRPATLPYLAAITYVMLRALCIGAGGWFTARSFASISAHEYPRILAATLFGQIVGFLAFFVPAGIGVQEEILLVVLRPLFGPAALIYALLFRALQIAADAITGLAGLMLLRASPPREISRTDKVDSFEVSWEILRTALRKPNFFIVGAAKCGTTSLHDYLDQHPEIFLPAHKEPLYFARDLDVPAEWCVRDDRRYVELFAKADPAAKRLGEASVWYLFSKTAASEIHAFDPNARIIIMLRDPIDAMYSLHGQFLWNCNDDILDFEQALAAQPDRKAGRQVPPEAHIPAALQYTDVMTFYPQVLRYIETFGRENVHIILFDDFATDTAGEYRKVLEFLDVDPHFVPPFSIVNAAKPITPGFNRFFARRPRLRQIIRNLIPVSILRSLNKLLPFLVRTVRRPSTIDPRLRNRLLVQFEPGIQALEELLNRDLSAWKQPRDVTSSTTPRYRP